MIIFEFIFTTVEASVIFLEAARAVSKIDYCIKPIHQKQI